MKKIVLIALVFLSLAMPTSQAKDKNEEVKLVLIRDDNTSNYYYVGVVPVEGVTKEEMFKRAKDWVLSSFKTGEKVQFDEKELVVYNNPTVILGVGHDEMNFNISIYFKEGKYKFRFENVIIISVTVYGPVSTPYSFNGPTKIQIKQCNVSMLALSASLENAVKGTSKKDNW